MGYAGNSIAIPTNIFYCQRAETGDGRRETGEGRGERGEGRVEIKLGQENEEEVAKSI